MLSLTTHIIKVPLAPGLHMVWEEKCDEVVREISLMLDLTKSMEHLILM